MICMTGFLVCIVWFETVSRSHPDWLELAGYLPRPPECWVLGVPPPQQWGAFHLEILRVYVKPEMEFGGRDMSRVSSPLIVL